MTPSSVKAAIKDKFPSLFSGGYIKTECRGNVLKISGSIICVSAMHRYIMQGLIPTHCKQMLRLENIEKKKAVYTYNFTPNGLPGSPHSQKPGLKT